MKKIFLNFADINFKKQQEFALKAAKYRGNFDKVIGLNPNVIDETFHKKYKHILNQKKGCGYWLWKPYIIVRTLSQLSHGDYLFYSDAGVFFLKKVDVLIDELCKFNQDIMGFEIPLIEEQFTKKELFINMNCDEKKYIESNQLLASYMLIRKTEFSEVFFNEFLKYACEEINITDLYSNNIQQSKCFIDHRRDQSIYSLLYKKYNLRPFKEPSQMGKHQIKYAQMKKSEIEDKIRIQELCLLNNGRKIRIKKYSEKYSLVLYQNRKNDPLRSLIRYFARVILSRLGLWDGIPC